MFRENAVPGAPRGPQLRSAATQFGDQFPPGQSGRHHRLPEPIFQGGDGASFTEVKPEGLSH